MAASESTVKTKTQPGDIDWVLDEIYAETDCRFYRQGILRDDGTMENGYDARRMDMICGFLVEPYVRKLDKMANITLRKTWDYFVQRTKISMDYDEFVVALKLSGFRLRSFSNSTQLYSNIVVFKSDPPLQSRPSQKRKRSRTDTRRRSSSPRTYKRRNTGTGPRTKRSEMTQRERDVCDILQTLMELKSSSAAEERVQKEYINSKMGGKPIARVFEKTFPFITDKVNNAFNR